MHAVGRLASTHVNVLAQIESATTGTFALNTLDAMLSTPDGTDAPAPSPITPASDEPRTLADAAVETVQALATALLPAVTGSTPLAPPAGAVTPTSGATVVTTPLLPASDTTRELLALLAAMLVMSNAVLSPDLQRNGLGTFNYVYAASHDLRRLVGARKLVLRVIGDDALFADARAIALAKIAGALERLQGINDVMLGQVSMVRERLAALGVDADINPFESSLRAIATEVADELAATRDLIAPASHAADAVIKRINANAQAAVEQLKATADAVIVAAAESVGADATQIAAEPLDTASLATTPLASTASAVLEPAAITVDALLSDPSPIPIPVAPTAVVQAADYRDWIASLQAEYGSLDVAAAAFALDDGEQLTALLQGIFEQRYDPSGAAWRRYGGNIGFVFTTPDLVRRTFEDALFQHGRISYLLEQAPELLRQLFKRHEQRPPPWEHPVPANRLKLLTMQESVVIVRAVSRSRAGSAPELTPRVRHDRSGPGEA